MSERTAGDQAEGASNPPRSQPLFRFCSRAQPRALTFCSRDRGRIALLSLALLLHSAVLYAQEAPLAPDAHRPSPTETHGAPREPSADPQANSKRQRLLNEGLALRRKGDDRAALERFEAALELGRDARVLAQIALAEEALGRWSKSYVHLREALTDSGHRWIQSNRTLLDAELSKIEAEVGRLEISVNEAGAEVTVDGERIGQSPLHEAVISNPGTVVVTVTKPGFVNVTRPVAVDAGGLTRSDVSLVAIPPPAPLVAPVEKKPEPVRTVVVTRRNPVWLYVAGGGALLALSSIGPWLGAGRQTDGIVADCTDDNGCASDTWQSSHDRVQTLDRTANGLLYSGLAVAALATGAYFLFPKRETRRDVRPGAWLTPQSVGLSASGSFGGLR